ncbi:uncharacterized protein F5891DRAFT_983321 [Suillus fuscotomentosus]|uniref:Uncharacterized protein n=1 Tax=Suillus fuscotomentosus TaxID=1912939 RepID=A0AAD4DZ01_9AGAM|nr:uncharacterized protein F5891DRAFT_983321 [Suillus fuscotomentosus]KAG1896721.1 hypothetical protein F5891DRAFT_983321 [Suillus fuscotomentosus]
MATMILAGGIDWEVELLNHSIPIWPTQLRWYTERTLPESLSRDYHVQKMQIGLACHEVHGHWQEFVHPFGAVYHYNAKSVSRSKIEGKQWLLVVEPILARGQEIYLYYYVVPENHIITWIEPVDAYLLFQECTAAWHWNHKRLELEAQYWKHIKYFPHGIKMHHSEALALEKSTAGSIFWTLEQMKEMTAELAIAADGRMTEELAGSDGVMEEQGVAICGKLLHILRHHKYLNHHGQPEAHLMRMHSLGEKRTDLEKPTFMTAVAVAMFWVPIMKFIDDFSAQAKSQTTVVSVIMAVDASILAIPVLEQAYYLQGKMLLSIFGFLAGVFAIEYGLPLSARIGCGLALLTGTGLTILLTITAFGPGLIRTIGSLSSVSQYYRDFNQFKHSTREPYKVNHRIGGARLLSYLGSRESAEKFDKKASVHVHILISALPMTHSDHINHNYSSQLGPLLEATERPEEIRLESRYIESRTSHNQKGDQEVM